MKTYSSKICEFFQEPSLLCCAYSVYEAHSRDFFLRFFEATWWERGRERRCVEMGYKSSWSLKNMLVTEMFCQGSAPLPSSFCSLIFAAHASLIAVFCTRWVKPGSWNSARPVKVLVVDDGFVVVLGVFLIVFLAIRRIAATALKMLRFCYHQLRS